MSEKGKLTALLAVAAADGRIDEKETMLLTALCVKYGLSPADVQEVASNPGRYASQLPTSTTEKREFVKEMGAMMAVDGQIDESEAEIIAAVSIVMGLSAQEAKSALFGN